MTTRRPGTHTALVVWPGGAIPPGHPTRYSARRFPNYSVSFRWRHQGPAQSPIVVAMKVSVLTTAAVTALPAYGC